MSIILASRQPSFPLPSSRRDTHSNSSTPQRNVPMLSSFRNKLSRKGSGDSSSTSSLKSDSAAPKPKSNNLPRSPISNPQPTRRPDRPGMNAFTTPTTEPPPPYTPNPPPANSPVLPSAPAAASVPTSEIAEDSAYSFLSTFDTIFVIDDSGSMAGRSWRETSQALQSIAPICTRFDTDGIDVRFLNAPVAPSHSNVTTAAAVQEIFKAVKPSSSTPTGVCLRKILKPYLAKLEADPEGTKPMNVIVITDGRPTDDPESELIAAARKLDKLDAAPWQLGVQFFQVGNEPGAADYLKQLDDDLEKIGDGCRDIVDTTPFMPDGLTADEILKAVLGAVNRRLDRRRNSDVVANGRRAK